MAYNIFDETAKALTQDLAQGTRRLRGALRVITQAHKVSDPGTRTTMREWAGDELRQARTTRKGTEKEMGRVHGYRLKPRQKFAGSLARKLRAAGYPQARVWTGEARAGQQDVQRPVRVYYAGGKFDYVDVRNVARLRTRRSQGGLDFAAPASGLAPSAGGGLVPNMRLDDRRRIEVYHKRYAQKHGLVESPAVRKKERRTARRRLKLGGPPAAAPATPQDPMFAYRAPGFREPGSLTRARRTTATKRAKLLAKYGFKDPR